MPKPPLFCNLYRCLVKARDRSEKIAKKEKLDKKLCGLCARGSAILYTLLDKQEIKAEIIRTRADYCHCYVRVDNYILDISATQFGKGRYCIWDSRHTFLGEWTKIKTVYNNINQLKTDQIEEGWPKSQIIKDTDYDTL